jgi:hypothetical protein
VSTHDPHGSPEHPPVGDGQHYWLDEPKNIKKVIRGFYVVCAVVFLGDVAHQMLSHRHQQGPDSLAGLEAIPGFYAVYGLVACSILVILAKYFLRPAVMRDEAYYD